MKFLRCGIFLLLLLLGMVPGWAEETDEDNPSEIIPFEEDEPMVAAAPAQPDSLPLAPGERGIDLAVSPIAPEVVFWVEDAKGVQSLRLWSLGHPEHAITPLPALPDHAAVSSLVWHPKGGRLFASGGKKVFTLDLREHQWQELWQAPSLVDHLVAGPRPFTPGYRLFFAQVQTNGTRWIGSIDVQGKHPYLVTSAVPPSPAPESDNEPPNTEIMPDATPVMFHPSGGSLIVAKEKGCFVSKNYNVSNWEDANPLAEPCGGVVGWAPNGSALYHWQNGKNGVEWVEELAHTRQTIAPEWRFQTMPRLTSDGKGLVGLVPGEGGMTVRYQPVALPLADVTNAWLFLHSAKDIKLFSDQRGLFRPLSDAQLYQFYESELYCASPEAMDRRPYLVTTDLFWELYAAAYEGIFLVLERQRAIPALQEMVALADRELTAKAPGSRMAKAFAAAAGVLTGNPKKNVEAARLLAGQEVADSEVLGEKTDYSLFAPRGHYAREEPLKNYFRAVRYLGHLKSAREDAAYLEPDETALLRGLSPEVQSLASRWIGVYQIMIAPSRVPWVWDPNRPVADYVSRKVKGAALFPLSWGWDNEVLGNVIHHEDQPLVSKDGRFRVLPTGLDLAMALGSGLGERLLTEQDEFATYPALKARLEGLRQRFMAGGPQEDGKNLYARWLRALATQWAKTAPTPIDGPVWESKRLQTGLASWATLRHATVLVNTLEGAECGEGGFEWLRKQPPRGYVEPDPATFAAIAGLFDATIQMVRQQWPAQDPLAKGIIRRLEQSKAHVIRFGLMAARQSRGETLTPMEYRDIHHVARTAEHNFLVFLSLMNKEQALSTPDPMMKVVDVAGRSETGFLEAAVGHPLEWDQITPYFGRRQIVKGAVYAYHEWIAKSPLNDEEWRKQVADASHPPWIARYMSDAAKRFVP
ncbi:MAG: DUF3160 domain-containing protein [Magnetococcales bacterium]|nr:DUF3160 domain-containing protein [Magnetococcales bacterium]